MRSDKLRALNVPMRVAVSIDAAGLPAGITGEGAAARKVEAVGEVWRVEDEWWRAPIYRRYIELVVEGGGHVVVYEDLVTGDWFEQMP